ncbi:hypothetical protein LCGC14_2116020 [marine sediment metagenome]|uniref:Uncharacterized protein n=1 Tax=marine sediment metagenome TaxID=412755 RepID=A0A0F9E5R9_9ZZZZ
MDSINETNQKRAAPCRSPATTGGDEEPVLQSPNGLEHYWTQIAEYALETRETAACRDLWRAVMAYTVLDLQYLKRFGGTARTKHQREMVRDIQESPPSDFVESDWFQEICDYLEVDPAVVRRGMEERFEQAA